MGSWMVYTKISEESKVKVYEIVLEDWSTGHRVEKTIKYFKAPSERKLNIRCNELDMALPDATTNNDLYSSHCAYLVDPFTKERK